MICNIIMLFYKVGYFKGFVNFIVNSFGVDLVNIGKW